MYRLLLVTSIVISMAIVPLSAQAQAKKSGGIGPKKGKLESKTERCKRCVDLARKLRAKGKYDAASASYREAIKSALTKELKHGIARELGEVLEVQKKWKKALKIYSQQRMGREEILLLKKLKKFKRGVETAKLYSDYSSEGDMLFGLKKYRDAMKAYQKSQNRLGEALCLLALNYRKRGLELLVKNKFNFEAGIELHRTKGLEKAKPYYVLAKTEREKKLIGAINKIRLLRLEMNPTKRLERKLPPLDDEKRRILRIKLAKTYKAAAKLYEELAVLNKLLEDNTKAKQFYAQAINFMGKYKEHFTDNGTDKFGSDRLDYDGYLEHLGRIKEAMGKL